MRLELQVSAEGIFYSLDMGGLSGRVLAVRRCQVYTLADFIVLSS